MTQTSIGWILDVYIEHNDAVIWIKTDQGQVLKLGKSQRITSASGNNNQTKMSKWWYTNETTVGQVAPKWWLHLFCNKFNVKIWSSTS
jgi:hypothetical protein